MDIEKELEKYTDTEEMLEDISWHQNECYINEKPIPTDEETRKIVLEEKRKQLVAKSICESDGHNFIETNADGENGRSDLDCQCCGFTQQCQW